MFEDKLLLIAGFENDRVLVERTDAACQFYSTDEIDRDIVPLLSCRVEEGILNVLLRRLGIHLPISLFRVRCCAMSLGEGRWLQLSCRLLQYRLAARFSTSRATIFSGAAWLVASSRSVSGFRKRRPGFLSSASHLQSSVQPQV